MTPIIDFNNAKTAQYIYYGGNAGAKDAIVYEDVVWMLNQKPQET